MRRVLFLSGVKGANDSKNPLLPQHPSVMSENFTVNYPILMYKTNIASDNQMVVANLSDNRRQKFINLHPFRMVQFI